MIWGEHDILWLSYMMFGRSLPYDMTTSADELHRKPYSYIDYLDDKYYKDMVGD